MSASFIQLCSHLDRLSRENDIEPPEMTLTFASDSQRRAFEGMLKREFSHLSMFPHGEVRFDSCHGIKFWLSAKRFGRRPINK